MKKQFGPYRRIARGLLGCSSLWQGPDHLLYVRGTGLILPFREEYIRFAFKDIQSVAIAPTRIGTIVTVVSATIAAAAMVAGALLFWAAGDAVMQAFYKVMAALCAALAVIALPLCLVNLALGPTCHCAVQSEGQSHRLRPLRRLRRARKVAAALAATIRSHQASPPGIA